MTRVLTPASHSDDAHHAPRAQLGERVVQATGDPRRRDSRLGVTSALRGHERCISRLIPLPDAEKASRHRPEINITWRSRLLTKTVLRATVPHGREGAQREAGRRQTPDGIL